MKGVKAFNKGLICRDFQYAENKIFETSEKVNPCNSGFHYCSEENALSVLIYYPPTSEFRLVEGLGDNVLHEDKIVTNKLEIKTKISLSDLFKIQFSFIKDICLKSKDANTSGNDAHANTSGNYAHANTSGYKAHANTSGDEAIASALGFQSKAKAEKGWIIIVDWQLSDKEDKYFIHNIHTAKVGEKIKGVKIEPTKWYWFENGELKSE